MYLNVQNVKLIKKENYNYSLRLEYMRCVSCKPPNSLDVCHASIRSTSQEKTCCVCWLHSWIYAHTFVMESLAYIEKHLVAQSCLFSNHPCTVCSCVQSNMNARSLFLALFHPLLKFCNKGFN